MDTQIALQLVKSGFESQAEQRILVKCVLVLHLQLSLSIDSVFCMSKRFSKVSHDKLLVIDP